MIDESGIIRLTETQWEVEKKLKRKIIEIEYIIKRVNENGFNYNINFSRSFIDASGNNDREVFYLDFTKNEKLEILDSVLKKLNEEYSNLLKT